MPATYVCLFHGETIADSRLVAASCDPVLARTVASEMASDPFCDPADPDTLKFLANAACFPLLSVAPACVNRKARVSRHA